MNRETFDRIFNGLYIVQNPDEFFWLVNLVESLNPNAIIEIGIECGGSFKFWEQLLPKDGLLIGIDPQHPKTKVRWDWEHSDRDILILEGYSQDPAIISKVREKLGWREVDFLFIDSEDNSEATKCDFPKHTSEGAKRDFENYVPFIRKNGLVGFHDVNDVMGFFSSLPERKEICQKSIGTGVWWKQGC